MIFARYWGRCGILYLMFQILIFPGSNFLAAQNSNKGFGQFIDKRDGQIYKTIRIGKQQWMAQNLNFGAFVSTNDSLFDTPTKYCYDNKPINCDTYGGLYTWLQINEHYFNLCPDGWRISSKEDWETLASYLGTKEAGEKLKANKNDSIPWDGTNETGFNAIPSGAGNGESFLRMNDWAVYWTSNEVDAQRAWFVQLDGLWYPQPPRYKKIIIDSYYLKSNTLSVRCIKNQD